MREESGGHSGPAIMVTLEAAMPGILEICAEHKHI
jgi:hypothetical protein